jgi:vancomycin permeability regulator SanA
MMKSKGNRTKRGFISGVIILILLLDLFFLIYTKYENQGLPVSRFNLFFLGNILNLFFTFATILGMIFYALSKKSTFSPAFMLTFTILLSSALIVAAMSTRVRLPLPNVYFLDHPLQKIAEGALFSFYQYLLFLFIAIIWLTLVSRRELIILRSIVNSAALVMLLLVATFVYINLKKDEGKKFTPVKNSINVAVVLGAAVWSHNSPSPSLAARADKAVELYRKGIVNKILVTGSNTPGEMSEADVAFYYIKLENVDTSVVWLETNTTSTAEQVRFIRDQIFTKKNIGMVIIVSDSYHLTRVREMCKFYKIRTELAASDLKLNFQHNLYYKMKESIALLVFWLFAL